LKAGFSTKKQKGCNGSYLAVLLDCPVRSARCSRHSDGYVKKGSVAEALLAFLKDSKSQALANQYQHIWHTTLPGEAEACFQKALAVARHQSAKSLELRAVMSLSRLWQQQGKQHEAHKMLAEIYGWFTEGFDTKDLQEAKALLEALS
jgi:hypothetical protein